MNDSLKIENLTKSLEIGNGVDALNKSQEKSEGFSIGSGTAGATGGAPSGSFTQMLEKAIDKTNEMQVQADHATKELMAGRTKNIHEAMLVLERADMSLKMMMQVRNKVLDAYKEIMRMQV